MLNLQIRPGLDEFSFFDGLSQCESPGTAELKFDDIIARVKSSFSAPGAFASMPLLDGEFEADEYWEIFRSATPKQATEILCLCIAGCEARLHATDPFEALKGTTYYDLFVELDRGLNAHGGGPDYLSAADRNTVADALRKYTVTFVEALIQHAYDCAEKNGDREGTGASGRKFQHALLQVALWREFEAQFRAESLDGADPLRMPPRPEALP